ncbi:MAG: hypothetical protein OK474_06855 [Thaumarchaeota archaeon]|nr:hypothetical protein [Nitrososphaerota archaeon]
MVKLPEATVVSTIPEEVEFTDQSKWTLNVCSLLVFVLLDEENEVVVGEEELDEGGVVLLEVCPVWLLDWLVLNDSHASVVLVCIGPDENELTVTQYVVSEVLWLDNWPFEPEELNRRYAPATAAIRIMARMATAIAAIPLFFSAIRLLQPSRTIHKNRGQISLDAQTGADEADSSISNAS